MWTPPPGRLSAPLDDKDFEEFKKICSSQTSDPKSYPLAASVQSNVPVYSSLSLIPLIRGSKNDREQVMEELHHALSQGPGVLVIRGMIPGSVIDGAEKVTAEVRKAESGYGSRPSNRTFSYSQKHAVHNPESYAEYYANDILAAVSEAWLGPGYQITAMTNSIHKTDAKTQDIHRDYHVAHMPTERIQQIPLITQMTSQLLTLQSAIAHTDMPLEAGPTRFLPFSQQFGKGYLAFKRPEYVEWTSPRMVQLPLQKGDAVFFNPACFHQPGKNTLDTPRVANLLQISACWGRPMETNNRETMIKALWPVLKRLHKSLQSEEGEVKVNGQANGPVKGHETALTNGHSTHLHPKQFDALIAATADDYAFPRVIDLEDHGTGTQSESIKRALKENWTDEQFYEALEARKKWERW